MPVFSHITLEGTLSLVGFQMNPPLCEALGNFLSSNRHVSSPFMIRKLVLDDNMLKDADFANILKGLVDQHRIEYLCYSNNNEIGPLSLV